MSCSSELTPAVPTSSTSWRRRLETFWGRVAAASRRFLYVCDHSIKCTTRYLKHENLLSQSDYCVSYVSPFSVFLHLKAASAARSNIFSDATCADYTRCWIHPCFGTSPELDSQNKHKHLHLPRSLPKNSSAREGSNQIVMELPSQKERGAWDDARSWSCLYP
jgi:hypothetical protein